MRRITGKASLLYSIMVGCLIAASPSPATTQENGTASSDVKLSGGLLSATAKDADLRKLLEAVGEKAGVMFRIDPAVKGKVSVEFTGKSVQDALGVILGQVDGNNLLTGYDRTEKAKEIWILPKGTNPTTTEEDLRLRRFDEEDKKYLKEKYGSLQLAVWEVFGKIYGKGRWDSREWNPAFDRPPTLSGAWTLEGDVLGSQESALAFGLSFIKTYENLLQTRTEELRLNPRLTRNGNGYGFVFDQYLDGVPVEQGIAYISFDSHRLSLANSTFPGVKVSTIPKITPEEATARAVEENEKYFLAKNRRFKIMRDLTEDEKLRRGDAVLVILPVAIRSSYNEPPYNESPKGYTYYLTFRVPFSAGHYYIDAQTGSLVLRVTDTVQLTATVSGQVYPDRSYTENAGNLAGAEQASLQNLDVRLNENPPAHTNSTGQYSYNATDSVHLGLESTFDGGRDFVIVAEDAQHQDVPWDVNQSGNFTFDADPDNGFRPNAYYWADMASTWFFNNLATIINVDEAHGARARTTIRTNHAFLDAPDTLGETQGNWSIWFRPAVGSNLAASIFPDIMLHELSHAAAYAKRGGVIAGAAYGQGTGGVDESVADYFACRIADNTDFFSGAGSSGNFNIDLDPAGSEAKPTERIGAGVLDNRDWQHYHNGSVIASALWDSTKSVVTDSVLWDSLTTQWLMSYTPEALYDAIFEAANDAKYGKDPDQVGSHLWSTFSAHYMNLWVKPYNGGGVLVDWLRHRSPTYQGYYVYRNTTGIFDESSPPVMEGGVSKLFPAGTTSWADLSANSSSTTYHYAVRAVSADGQTKSPFSNEAFSKGEPSGGVPPEPPRSFYGSVTTRDGVLAVELTWMSGTSMDVAEHYIERAQDAGFTIEKFEWPVPAQYFSGWDKGGLPDESWPFLADTKYYYRIKAVDQAGLSSAWVLMNPAYVIPKVTLNYAPSKPTGIIAKTTTGAVYLTWTRPETSEDGNALSDLKEYMIYYQQLDEMSPHTKGPVPYTGTAQQSFDLTGLSSQGKAYRIAVTARDTAGNESEYSEWVYSKPIQARWVQPGYGPYETISAALSGAPDGTVIMVGPGTYYETALTIGTHSMAWAPSDIVIQSEMGPSVTVIDAGNAPRLLLDAADGVKIIGFTFKSSTSASGAIDCLFDNGVLIANNIFIGNRVAVSVGGVHPDFEPLSIYNNVFDGKALSESDGLSGFSTYGKVDVHNNIFLDNNAGIRLDHIARWHVEDNSFLGSGSDVVGVGPDDLSLGLEWGANPDCNPGFLNVIAGDPDAYHLGPTSSCANLGNPALKEPWLNCDGSSPDLGAFGGPYAYTDNDGDGIPDCEQPRAVVVAAFLYAGDRSVPVTLNAVDPMGGDLTYSLESLPAHGALFGDPPNLVYTVNPSFTGVDSFEYRAMNGTAASNRAPATITVRESDNPPIAISKTITVRPNHTALAILEGSDADGDPLTFTVDTISMNGSLEIFHNPKCFFFPPDGYVGIGSFTYHASDGFLDSAPATVTIIVNNDPTIDSFEPAMSEVHVPADRAAKFSVSASDLDVAGDTLQYTWFLDGIQVGASAPAFAYNPAQGAAASGAHHLRVVVSDQLATAEHSWTVLVRETVVQDNAASGGSGWSAATSGSGFLNGGYLVHTAQAGATGTVAYTWNIPVEVQGVYKVYARWPAAGNYTANATFLVTDATGVTDDIKVDQTTNGGNWNLLGTYRFGVTASVTVQVDKDETGVADAVRLVATDDPADIIIDDPAGYPYGSWATVNGSGFGGSYRNSTGVAVQTESDPEELVAAPATKTFTWTPAVPIPGTWDLYARWKASSGAASNAKYVVNYDGTRNVQCTVDQRSNGSRWVLLGTFTFEETDAPSFSIGNNAIGIVVADAVKLVFHSGGTPSVVDDPNAVFSSSTGTWASKKGIAGYIGVGYRQIPAPAAGVHPTGTAEWQLPITGEGNYEIYARWTDGTDRTTVARYEIHYNGQNEFATVTVNQRSDGGKWNYLGRFKFDTDPGNHVRLYQGTDGATVADAIMALRTDEDLPIIIDNRGAGVSFSSGWAPPSVLMGGYWGEDYSQARASGKTAVWRPQFDTSGSYDVYARWTAASDRTTGAEYSITYDGGLDVEIVTRNQTKSGGSWVSFGRFPFRASSTGDVQSITLRSTDSSRTIADAVRFDYTVLPPPIVIDNNDFNNAEPEMCTADPGWATSTSFPNCYGSDGLKDYLIRGAGQSGVVRWTPSLPLRGYYAVHVWWPTPETPANFASQAPFKVVDAQAPAGVTRMLNQQSGSGKWNYLGTFLFDAQSSADETAGYVELSAAASGKVMADAVRFTAEGR